MFRFGSLGAVALGGFTPLVADGIAASVDINFQTDQASILGTLSTSTSPLTVTRATPTTAYAQDNSGNWIGFGAGVARRTNKGLLVEESRTNLFLNSQVPVTQSITVVNSTVYTVSVIGTGSLTLSGAGSGTVSAGSPVTFTSTTTSLTVTTSGITGSFVNAQVEAGSFATSPIVTAGASVTRAEDIIQATSAITFGSSYSLFASGIPNAPVTYTVNQIIGEVNDGTSNNRAAIVRVLSSAQVQTAQTVGGVGGTGTGSVVAAQGSASKFAAAFAASDQVISVNGSNASANANNVSVPVVSKFTVGDIFTGGRSWNGYVTRFAIWPSNRITNASLKSIST